MFLRPPKDISSYLHALSSPCLDSSSFVLLTFAILEKKLDSKMATSDKMAIMESFLDNDFSLSIKIIMKICLEHDELKNNNLMTCLREKKFELNDDPLQNKSRRFFESVFALKLWGSLSHREFKSIGKLSTIIKEMNPKLNPAAEVKTHKDAQSLIALLREFGESHPDIVAVHNSIRQNSPISNQKDRGSQKEKTFSSNPGILKSLDPCFPSHIKTCKSGRVVDMFNIDAKKQGFSSSNKQVPFVNSVSGTAFTIASVLHFYMHKYKDLSSLATDVNHVVKGFLAFTCMNGYHSLTEMLCVLKSQEVTALFATFNVKLDLSFPEKVIKTAFEESIEYAKKLSLQELMHAELRARGPQ